MTISLEELRRRLSAEEPIYSEIAAALDADSTAHLQLLAADPDPMLASKAVYASSMSRDAAAHAIVDAASGSQHELLRLASASALPHLPAAMRDTMIERLLDEPDVSLQKLALRSIQTPTPTMQAKLTQLQQSHEVHIRELSARKLTQTP